MIKKSRIPYIFIIFFGIIFVVDAFYIYLANTTWQGVVIDKVNLKKINYENFANLQKAQDKLGWNVDIKHKISNKNIFNIEISVSKNNIPLKIKSINLDLRHPKINKEQKNKITQCFDKICKNLNIEMNKQNNNLFYSQIALPYQNNWQCFITIKDYRDNIYKEFINF